MTSTANTPIGKCLRNMGKLSEDRQESLEKLSQVAYHIALRGCPYTDFVNELEAQTFQKVVFFKSGSYENEPACREFIIFCSSQHSIRQLKKHFKK